MDFLREYIRDLICDGPLITQVFYERGEHKIAYDPDTVWNQAALIAEAADVDVDDYELKYFGRDMDGKVSGAAWVAMNEGKFEFVITLNELTAEEIHEELIRDCLDEFAFQSTKESMVLEVSVDNEKERIAFENAGLVVLKEYVGTTIMGNGS